MSTFHPAASSLENFDDAISTISTTRLFIYISSRQEPTFVMASQHTLLEIPRWTSSPHGELSGYFYLPSTLSCTRATHVVNFCLSLLSAYWVLSAYFFAVLEISVCAYYPVCTVCDASIKCTWTLLNEQSNRTPRCSQEFSAAGLPWFEHFRVQCYT